MLTDWLLQVDEGLDLCRLSTQISNATQSSRSLTLGILDLLCRDTQAPFRPARLSARILCAMRWANDQWFQYVCLNAMMFLTTESSNLAKENG